MIKFLIPARWDFPLWVVWDQKKILLSEQACGIVKLAIFLNVQFILSFAYFKTLALNVFCNDDTLLPSSLWDFPLWVVMICAFPFVSEPFENFAESFGILLFLNKLVFFCLNHIVALTSFCPAVMINILIPALWDFPLWVVWDHKVFYYLSKAFALNISAVLYKVQFV